MPKLNAFQLKIIAIIGMITNHLVLGLKEIIPMWLAFPMYALGGLTFPILAFFVMEGYKYTSDLKKYMLRIFIFGLISIPFHAIVFREFMPNIMFTILLGIISAIAWDKAKNRILFWVIFTTIIIITILLRFEWTIIGPIVVLLYHIIKNENIRRMASGFAAGMFNLIYAIVVGGMLLLHDATTGEMPDIIYSLTGGDVDYFITGSGFIIGCFAATFLIKGFNGERGRKIKWAFYIIYPLHLAIIAAISLFLGFAEIPFI
jgi:hypothetical protein